MKCIVAEEVGAAAGQPILAALQAAIARQGSVRLGVPGGGSPAPVFRWLAANMPASVAQCTTVTLVDERHAASEADSNLANLHRHWLRATATPPHIEPLDHPGDVHAAAARLAADFEALDVVLLGAGPDGHIASLFPGHAALGAKGPVVAVTDSPKPPPERLTLTLDVLNNVDLAVLVASGSAKAPMLARVAAGDTTLPLGRIRPRGDWLWVLDPAAAEALPPRS